MYNSEDECIKHCLEVLSRIHVRLPEDDVVYYCMRPDNPYFYCEELRKILEIANRLKPKCDYSLNKLKYHIYR